MKVDRSFLVLVSTSALIALLTGCGSHGASGTSTAAGETSTSSTTDVPVVAATPTPTPEPGESSLISMTRVSTTLTGCASGSGLQLNSGLDTNRDDILEKSEITQTQVLCDGKDGAVGAAGATGASGHGLVFRTTPASTAACPAGGTVIVMATDINNNGKFDSKDTNKQATTLCNGIKGATGASSAYTPITTIMPCGNTAAYKEVLLRLSNGDVLSSFSDDASGAMTRLTLLPDGDYIDTDDNSCKFSLATSSNGKKRAISWLGKVQMTWNMISSN